MRFVFRRERNHHGRVRFHNSGRRVPRHGLCDRRERKFQNRFDEEHQIDERTRSAPVPTRGLHNDFNDATTVHGENHRKVGNSVAYRRLGWLRVLPNPRQTRHRNHQTAHGHRCSNGDSTAFQSCHQEWTGYDGDPNNRTKRGFASEAYDGAWRKSSIETQKWCGKREEQSTSVQQRQSELVRQSTSAQWQAAGSQWKTQLTSDV